MSARCRWLLEKRSPIKYLFCCCWNKKTSVCLGIFADCESAGLSHVGWDDLTKHVFFWHFWNWYSHSKPHNVTKLWRKLSEIHTDPSRNHTSVNRWDDLTKHVFPMTLLKFKHTSRITRFCHNHNFSEIDENWVKFIKIIKILPNLMFDLIKLNLTKHFFLKYSTLNQLNWSHLTKPVFIDTIDLYMHFRKH